MAEVIKHCGLWFVPPEVCGPISLLSWTTKDPTPRFGKDVDGGGGGLGEGFSPV